MSTSRSGKPVAALAKRCGITEEANRAIDRLIRGDAVLYRRLITDRLHGAGR